MRRHRLGFGGGDTTSFGETGTETGVTAAAGVGSPTLSEVEVLADSDSELRAVIG
jgi:hypothetical protein